MFNKKEYAKKWRKENPKIYKRQLKRYYKKHRKEIIARVSKYDLKKKYNLTPKELDDLLKKQNNKCAICELQETANDRSGKLKRLSIDHNHTTGKIRGLLCDRCNRVLGFLEWAKGYEKQINSYLEKYK